MPESGGNGGALKPVNVYKDDAEETDRILGSNVSWAKRYREMLKLVKRERLVDKLRRAILGVEEATGQLVGGITRETGPDQGKPGSPGAPR
jgi:hypothetical protein